MHILRFKDAGNLHEMMKLSFTITNVFDHMIGNHRVECGFRKGKRRGRHDGEAVTLLDLSLIFNVDCLHSARNAGMHREVMCDAARSRSHLQYFLVR